MGGVSAQKRRRERGGREEGERREERERETHKHKHTDRGREGGEGLIGQACVRLSLSSTLTLGPPCARSLCYRLPGRPRTRSAHGQHTVSTRSAHGRHAVGARPRARAPPPARHGAGQGCLATRATQGRWARGWRRVVDVRVVRGGGGVGARARVRVFHARARAVFRNRDRRARVMCLHAHGCIHGAPRRRPCSVSATSPRSPPGQ